MNWEPTAALAGLLLVVVLYQQVRLRQLNRERQRGNLFPAAQPGEGGLVLNFSGHPMQAGQAEDNWLARHRVVDLSPGNVDMHDPVAAARLLLGQAQSEIEAALARGLPLVVALPGATALAVPLLALVHGLTGSYPLYTWAVREEGRHLWKKPVDLQTVRAAGRTRRGLEARDL